MQEGQSTVVGAHLRPAVTATSQPPNCIRLGCKATRPSGVEHGGRVHEDWVCREDSRCTEEVPLIPALDFERKGEARPGGPDLGLSLLAGVRGVGDLDSDWDGREDGRIWPPTMHKEAVRVAWGTSHLSCHTGDDG